MQFNVYYAQSKSSFVVKWKDGTTWKLKVVPKELQDEHKAHAWALNFMRGVELKPEHIKLTFAQITTPWLERREATGDKKLVSGSKTFIKRWLGELKDFPVEDITLQKATKWAEWVKRSCDSHYTSRNIVATMRSLIVEARGMGWVELKENVFADPWIRKVMADGTPTSIPIVRLEKHQLMQLLSSNLQPDRWFRYAFAVSTCLRLGELAALRKRDIQHGIVDVQRQLTDGQVKPPKKGSVRLVPLHPIIKSVLETNVVSGNTIFGTDQGNWSRTLREDLAQAGLQPRHRSGANFTFHAMRRTGLTILRSSGMPIEDVKAIAGHAGKSVTERHYAEADLMRLAEGIRNAFDQVLVGYPQDEGSRLLAPVPSASPTSSSKG